MSQQVSFYALYHCSQMFPMVLGILLCQVCVSCLTHVCLVLWLIHWAVNVLFTAFRMDHTDWLNGEMFDCNGCVCSVRSHLLRFLPHRLQMARMLLLTAWTGRDTGLSIWWFPSALGRGRSQVRHLERCTKPPEVKSTLIQLLARSMRQMKGFP